MDKAISMKKFILAAVAFCVTLTIHAQVFEGQITYANAYKSKNPQVSDQQWAKMMGDTQQYQIKGGDYRSDTNGTLMQWILFVNKDGKLYSKMATSETVYYNDVTIQGDEVYKSELKKGTTKILGYLCDELVLTCKNGVQKYYFNAQLGVDPKLFVNHKFGNWYDLVSRARALPLKSIIETTMFTLESTSTQVKPAKLDPNLFVLPKGVKTEKSPY